MYLRDPSEETTPISVDITDHPRQAALALRVVVATALREVGKVRVLLVFFFFNDTATTEIYTLSLHDALPISSATDSRCPSCPRPRASARRCRRSEEHTSELQSHSDLVCRLLLEKKKPNTRSSPTQKTTEKTETHKISKQPI